MIGVLAQQHPAWLIEEFFQLFKTPWEHYRPGASYDVLLSAEPETPREAAWLTVAMGVGRTDLDERLGLGLAEGARSAMVQCGEETFPLYDAWVAVTGPAGAQPLGRVGDQSIGLEMSGDGGTVLRLGYDLFGETGRILREGQPVAHAAIPTVDLHVNRLRGWMRKAGVNFVEIPPVPHGHRFMVSLTHDIDFIGLRQHRFDHTMLGFLYRATVGSLWNALRGRLSPSRMWRNWWAAARLPFVHMGMARDFWLPFPWYLEVESGLPATYYLIPFKRRPGQNVVSPHPARRGTAYDVTDMPEWTRRLLEAGCEIGVHGIDAWHDVALGREERGRIESATGGSETGIRMHWLQFDARSYSVLEEAGYDYDSTMGYNETVGYRHGTSQVFRPPGARRLLEMPMHIQDGALFYPAQMGLTEAEARAHCDRMVDLATRHGGVLTLLWHDRSHAPERFWGDFYRDLVGDLKTHQPWFASGSQVVRWFRRRRAVRFGGRDGQPVVDVEPASKLPPMTVRRHHRDGFSDEAWIGKVRHQPSGESCSRENPSEASAGGVGHASSH